ncbi:MAG TPA: AbrB/MazE/SpoVT family DNA-binding domain-containing protein [Nitrososphaerales archaeon]|nr:AbrB/MazE/SpoVT family DNA-binding domain-containing protein [Nitrososphaerales archaeon]
METVRVSRKYQVVIPERIRQEAGIKPGDRMVAIAKHGILQYVPVRPIQKTRGMIPGLDTAELRDETEAADYSLEHNLHFADALIYATARQASAKLYTSDEHMAGLQDVTIV